MSIDGINVVANPTDPEIFIEIAGERFSLVFDFKALAAARSRLRQAGVVVNLLRCLDFENLDADTISPLFFAACLHNHPDLTWERARDLVTMKTAGGIANALALAYIASMREGEPNPPTAAQTN